MKFWEVKAKEDDSIIELNIYGEICNEKFFQDDVVPLEIASEIKKYPKAKHINVYINSGGGSAFAGIAIYNILKRAEQRVTVYIDGLAASAASIIAMAGDKIIMPENAMIMIHNAWTIYAGDSSDFLEMAQRLENLDKTLVDTYAKRTGQAEEKIKQMMEAETWLGYKEAFDLGFCDEVEESKQIAACVKDGILNINGIEVEASKYKNFPQLKVKKVIEIKQKEEPQASQQPVVTGEDIKKYLEELENANY